jgi:hypothetical protein
MAMAHFGKGSASGAGHPQADKDEYIVDFDEDPPAQASELQALQRQISELRRRITSKAGDTVSAMKTPVNLSNVATLKRSEASVQARPAASPSKSASADAAAAFSASSSARLKASLIRARAVGGGKRPAAIQDPSPGQNELATANATKAAKQAAASFLNSLQLTSGADSSFASDNLAHKHSSQLQTTSSVTARVLQPSVKPSSPKQRNMKVMHTSASPSLQMKTASRALRRQPGLSGKSSAAPDTLITKSVTTTMIAPTPAASPPHQDQSNALIQPAGPYDSSDLVINTDGSQRRVLGNHPAMSLETACAQTSKETPQAVPSLSTDMSVPQNTLPQTTGAAMPVQVLPQNTLQTKGAAMPVEIVAASSPQGLEHEAGWILPVHVIEEVITNAWET